VQILEFKKIILPYVGIKGLAPKGWTKAGDGRFDRSAFDGDPTMLFEKSSPYVKINSVKAILSPFLGFDSFPN
jgi:hypothetical protein